MWLEPLKEQFTPPKKEEGEFSHYLLIQVLVPRNISTETDGDLF